MDKESLEYIAKLIGVTGSIATAVFTFFAAGYFESVASAYVYFFNLSDCIKLGLSQYYYFSLMLSFIVTVNAAECRLMKIFGAAISEWVMLLVMVATVILTFYFFDPSTGSNEIKNILAFSFVLSASISKIFKYLMNKPDEIQENSKGNTSLRGILIAVSMLPGAAIVGSNVATLSWREPLYLLKFKDSDQLLRPRLGRGSDTIRRFGSPQHQDAVL